MIFRKKPNAARHLAAGLLGLFLLNAEAFPSDFHSPRTVSLGGAGHAGPMLNDAIYLNPSYASFLPTYSVSVNYGRFRGNTEDFGQGPTDYYGRILNVSVQDGRSDLFQAGIGYTRREDTTFIHLGASRAFVQRFGLGIGGKIFYRTTVEGGAPMGYDSSVSVTAVAQEWLQAVLIGDNLVESSLAKESGLERQFILGTKINIKGALMIYIDPHLIPGRQEGDRTGYEAGVEFAIWKDVFGRWGVFKNSTIPFAAANNGKGIGFGAGWVAPRISFDYGYQRAFFPRYATSHNFGLTVFF